MDIIWIYIVVWLTIKVQMDLTITLSGPILWMYCLGRFSNHIWIDANSLNVHETQN